jgi:hypothetical protein
MLLENMYGIASLMTIVIYDHHIFIVQATVAGTIKHYGFIIYGK